MTRMEVKTARDLIDLAERAAALGDDAVCTRVDGQLRALAAEHGIDYSTLYRIATTGRE